MCTLETDLRANPRRSLIEAMIRALVEIVGVYNAAAAVEAIDVPGATWALAKPEAHDVGRGHGGTNGS
jgi:hypothetical protein